jgi:ribosomal protein S27E
MSMRMMGVWQYFHCRRCENVRMKYSRSSRFKPNCDVCGLKKMWKGDYV